MASHGEHDEAKDGEWSAAHGASRVVPGEAIRALPQAVCGEVSSNEAAEACAGHHQSLPYDRHLAKRLQDDPIADVPRKGDEN